MRDARSFSVAEVCEIEKRIEESGTPLAVLMTRAGCAVADEIQARLEKPVLAVVLAGAGNNGGDAWVCAAELGRKGFPVVLVTSKAAEDIDAQPAGLVAGLIAEEIKESNLPVLVLMNPSAQDVGKLLEKAGVIVDGILGTGFSGEAVRSPYDLWIKAANKRRFGVDEVAFSGEGLVLVGDVPSGTNKPAVQVADAPLAVAIDVPSGFHADTGSAAAPCFVADITVTMIVHKTGLLTDSGRAWSEACVLAPLDIDIEQYV